MSPLHLQPESHLVNRIGWFWGALAMALTAGIGKLFGTVV
jgi:hypothetical protein